MAIALTSAPVLETERLILRSDLPELTRFMTSSPRMHAQGETVSKEQAWFGFLTGVGHWQWHGFGFFTLVEHGQSHPVGRVGLLKHSNWPELSSRGIFLKGPRATDTQPKLGKPFVAGRIRRMDSTNW